MKVIDHTKLRCCLWTVFGPQRAVFGKKRRRIVHQLSLTLASQEHASRRLFTLPKLQIYASRLVDNAILQLQTDVKEYAEESIRNSEESGLFSLADYTVRNEVQVGTKYEQKW